MDTELASISQAKKDLSADERVQFDLQYATRRKNPTTALLLSLFLGTLGVDRFYVGDTGLGIAKLLTLGGLWIWALIDWFLIMGAARRKNEQAIHQIHDLMVQSRS